MGGGKYRKLQRLLTDVQTCMDKYHYEAMGNNSHLHLLFVSTDPEHQGKRVGSKMLSFVEYICDKFESDMYLETNNERLESFYHRYGFKTTAKYDLNLAKDYKVFSENYGMKRTYTAQ